jgi:hypothetical protein
MGWEGVDWIQLAGDTNQGLRTQSLKVNNFLTSRAPVNISSSTLLH